MTLYLRQLTEVEMKKDKKHIENLIEEPTFEYQAVSLINPFQVIALTRQGISKRQAMNLAEKFDFSPKELATIMHISERTLHRYQENDNLDSLTTSLILQLKDLYTRGTQVFGSSEKFKQWMRYSNPVFADNKPIDLLDTLTGFQLIFDELGRIEHGIFA